MKVKIKKSELKGNFTEYTDYIGFIIASGLSTGIITEDYGDELGVEGITTTTITDKEIIKIIEKKYGVSEVRITATKPFALENEIYLVGSSIPEN